MIRLLGLFGLCFSLLYGCEEIYASESLDPMLIGGRPAHEGEFPEIIYIRSGAARCSATVIGERVILTAGHCVKDEGEIGPVEMGVGAVDFVLGQQVYTAKCRQTPKYRQNLGDHDMAICLADRPLSVRPATIDTQPVKIGQTVILTGYGCIRSPGSGGNDGILRVGKAKVIQLPAGDDYWFYTKASSTLCFGDSGGPSMSKPHFVIGVNSRGDIKSLSLFTATFTKDSIDFFEEFAKEQSVSICGITEDC